ncbi:NHS-like protein 3 [Brachionichthys hirsutus]|uniref:NHS-like protein 3 n=1 Tax=Brachionichthys hirsutus TaxID=412623 RepID=UPI003604F848
MSNRDSLGFGDLLPQDVVDIFAQEKHNRVKKKRSHSLGRALGWLKGKKKKDLKAKGALGLGVGLGPALDLAVDGYPVGHQGQPKGGQRLGRQTHPQGNSHAIPTRDDDKTPAPPLLQENVFVEASRPEYLENLHTEALEGLKMMQQEETDHGLEYRDNESTISTMTGQTDGEGGGFMTDSTIADTTSVVSVQSSVSSRSSRSGLTRQKSTFRPLNSGNKPEKTKKRKRHRKTVGAIPQHVQMELGLDRGGWTVTRRLEEEQLYNGDTDNSPTADAPRQAAEPQSRAAASSEYRNAIQPVNRGQMKQLLATRAGHRDDMALLRCLGPNPSDEQRPRSLAVPWITTANSNPEPPSPVMSMSPQAAYMSKIIPNAVLPPSIDVVEISRGRSRNSVRTVSKSSLLPSSPAPSRASSKASSRASSRASTVTSASRNNPPNMSDSSCWSHSESSETLVSESSTISRSSTPQQRSPYAEGPNQAGKMPVLTSLPSTCASNGKVIIKGEVIKKEGQCVRSLSVMKPKRAPPPPNRSYSLHNKMKRRSRDLAEFAVASGGSPRHKISAPVGEYSRSRIPDSAGYNADTSSLEDSTGSASVSPIASHPVRAEEAVSKEAPQKKPELFRENKLSKVVSPSSGYSSQDGKSAPPHSSSSKRKKGFLAKLQRFFPGSSPPVSTRHLLQPALPGNSKLKEDLKSDRSVETASVSPSVRALIELFNIPPPPKVHAPPPPPPEVWAHSRRTFELLLGPPAPDNLNAIIKKNPKDRRQQRNSPSSSSSSSSTESSVKSSVERKHKSTTVTVETKKVQESVTSNAESRKEPDDRRANQNVDLKGNGKVTEKDEKVKVRDVLSGMLVKAVERREGRLAAGKAEEAKTSTPVTEVDSLPAISLTLHSSQPPANQTPGFASVASGQVASPEFSWPPPPPPPIGLRGSRDFELPLPPPPVFREEDLVMPVQVPPARTEPGAQQGISPVVLNIPPPPPYTAPPPPVKAVPPPTIKKISPPFHEEVSPPPPPKGVFLLQPKRFSPEPPEEVPSKETSIPPPKGPEEGALPPPEDVSLLPPDEIPPPPPKEVSPVRPKESPPHLTEKAPPPLIKDAPTTLVAGVSPPSVQENSPLPPKVVAIQVVSPPPPLPQVNVHHPSKEAPPVGELAPPENIPPPPPLQAQSQNAPPSHDSIPSPPASVSPPPPLGLLFRPQITPTKEEGPPNQEAPQPPPSDVSTQPALESAVAREGSRGSLSSLPASIPLPPPLPVEGLGLMKSNPANSENKIPELTSAPVAQEEPTLVVTPSILQMVKLRSFNSSPEHPEVPTSSASAETPQKPIRKSLIVTPPTSSRPPAVVISQTTHPSSQPFAIQPPSSAAAVSPTTKSPPAAPSMNLQEAIRLRTAARSQGSPAPRVSSHSQASPTDFHKSPTSTASFIFSKSNKRVVIETRHAAGEKAATKKNPEASPGTKVRSEAESPKVPPPVAKKPKPMGKDAESSAGAEQTAGQEAIKMITASDAEERSNGTAGAAGGTPST